MVDLTRIDEETFDTLALIVKFGLYRLPNWLRDNEMLYEGAKRFKKKYSGKRDPEDDQLIFKVSKDDVAKFFKERQLVSDQDDMDHLINTFTSYNADDLLGGVTTFIKYYRTLEHLQTNNESRIKLLKPLSYIQSAKKDVFSKEKQN